MATHRKLGELLDQVNEQFPDIAANYANRNRR